MKHAALLPFLLASLMAAAGCNGHSNVEIRPVNEAKEALFRINQNLGKLDRPLSCKGIVSMRFRDTEGREHIFFGNPTTIIVEQPQSLYFDVKSLAGSVGRMGSNDEHYWMWVTLPDLRKVWWGTWDALRAGRARRVAVDPRSLLDAWLMKPLPETLPDGTKPLLLAEGDLRRLVFPVLNSEGWPMVQREVYYQADAPGIPTRIVDRRRDGEIYMDARLGRFVAVDETGPGGPQTARSFSVRWPIGGATLDLSLDSVRFRESDTPFCEFDPASFDGESECLDQPVASLQPRLGDVH
ncbi:MAG: hypothetical protein HZB38_18290 [Planctomycetes bacterium]|nr:hypothetical protein [Planctomycetota bacterium]